MKNWMSWVRSWSVIRNTRGSGETVRFHFTGQSKLPNIFEHGNDWLRNNFTAITEAEWRKIRNYVYNTDGNYSRKKDKQDAMNQLLFIWGHQWGINYWAKQEYAPDREHPTQKEQMLIFFIWKVIYIQWFNMCVCLPHPMKSRIDST